MANNIKGITIQIDADGTPLERAINDINKESQALSSELRTINNQLKFDPQNTVVLQQKFDVLGEQIQKTKTKLETLENAQEKVKEMYENGEIDAGQYRAFQREVEKAENYLGNLEEQQEDVAVALKQELSTEYEDLQTKIQDTTTHLEELQAQQDAMGDAEIGTEAYEELSTQIEEAKSQLEGFQTEANAVSSQMADLDANAETLGIDFSKISEGANDSADGMGKAQGESSSLADALNKASGMAGTLGGTISGVLSGGIEGLMDIIPQVTEMIIAMVQQFDEANSTLVEMTGATGDALTEMNDIAKETSLVLDGMNVSDTAGVVGELNTRLDLTGQELQQATALVGMFADATGTDAEKSVKSLNDVMKTWGVETSDMESLLNKMVVAGQKSGISMDSLASTLSREKGILQSLGFDLDSSIGLLANFEKNAIDSSTAMMGFRTATNKWAKEGKNAQQGFADLSKSIQNATSEQEAQNIAIEYFGSRAGVKLADAIRDGRFEFDYMTEAIQDSNNALRDTEERADTFGEKAETFVGAVQTVAFSGESLGDWFSFASQQADLMGTSVGDATLQYLGLADAQGNEVTASENVQTASQNEQKEIQNLIQQEKLAEGEYNTMIQHQDSVISSLNDLQQAYTDSYNSAKSNIDKEVGLFEYMDMSGGRSIDDLIGSLDSQISFMYEYASNIRKAMEMGVDKGIVEKLSDGSVESARILQTIVDEGEGYVDEINEKLGLVEAGKNTFSDEFATMHTNFDTEMGKIEARMYLAVGHMDQYAQAYGNGSNTVKGFIQGSESHYTEIYNAYKKVAETANRAVKNTLKIQSPSRVMMKLGEYTAEGFAEGILKEMDIVENAMSRMATPDIKGMGDIAMTKTSRVISVTAPIQVMQRLDDAEIQRMGGRITDIVGRQFAKRTGGTL